VASKKCQKLARLLTEALKDMYSFEVYVDPEEIYSAQGWYRSSPHADCHRWEAFFKTPEGCAIGIMGSYDRLSDCARHGVKIFADSRWRNEFEVYADKDLQKGK
jgi:hypothetical protein